MVSSKSLLLYLMALFGATVAALADDDPPSARRHRALAFHLRAQERTGVIVPMYVYPADIRTNPAYNQLMDIKRRFETVPMWVIVNPASGPGEAVDANYTAAIARLQGAGCVVLGYVTTSYAKRSEADVRKDIDRWLKLYPRIQGVFFDEMIYEDTDAGAKYQAALNRYAHDVGCWPTVSNPGTNTPGRYFVADAADVILIHEDVILIHEGDTWPTEERLKGEGVGGYADHPPFTRGVLVHSQPKLDRAALRMARKYARWVYSTEGPFRLGDPKAANPWDRVSKHLEELCEQLSVK